MSRETVRLTADVVALSQRDGVTHVLLIRRGKEPYAGMWALPGGHVEAGETVANAAARELAEETGLTVDWLRPVGWYSAPGRDPRGRYVSAAFVAWMPPMSDPVAADDAAAAEWVPVESALGGGLAFDHQQIIRDAVVAGNRNGGTTMNYNEAKTRLSQITDQLGTLRNQRRAAAADGLTNTTKALDTEISLLEYERDTHLGPIIAAGPNG